MMTNTDKKKGIREAFIERKTEETQIRLDLNLDGSGEAVIESPVPFLNHMLNLFTRHGLFNLTIKADGDVEIDGHHTSEDIAICLGQAIRQALGDKKGINRYGHAVIPMDEALTEVVIDLSDRPFYAVRGSLPAARIGDFDTELVDEFLSKLAMEARMNLHVDFRAGRNTHHMIEAAFKALGRALDEAVQIDPRVTGVPSTKGSLS